MHVHVDSVAADIAVPAVDRFFKLSTAEDLVRILNQLLEQHELAPLECNVRAPILDGHGAEVKHELTATQAVR